MPLQASIPTGAPADVAELEYCSAIRQTDVGLLRVNGTIDAEDVQLHILSRHGVQAGIDTIERAVMRGLGGSFEVPPDKDKVNESDGALGADARYMPLDMVQQTAMLFIPELLKARQAMRSLDQTSVRPASQRNGTEQGSSALGEIEEETSNDLACSASSRMAGGPESSSAIEMSSCLFEVVLLIMLEEAGIEYGAELSTDVLRRLLSAFGEESWYEDIINGMVAIAANGKEMPLLVAETLAWATTADVQLFDTTIKETSHFQDVNACHDEDDPSPLLSRCVTLSSLDYTADTYASLSWATLSWFALAGAFFSYMLSLLGFPEVGCTTLSSFGCKVAASIALWLEIFVELCLVCVPILFLITAGNSIYLFDQNKWLHVGLIMIGVATIVIVTIVAYRYTVETPYFSTRKIRGWWPLYNVTLAVGGVVLLIQLVQIARILMQSRLFMASCNWLFPTAFKSERMSKEAATFKVSRMMDRALKCHLLSDKEQQRRSRRSTNYERLAQFNLEADTLSTLHHYNSQVDDKEEFGGIWWTFRTLLIDRRLTREEGLWLFPRVLWSNFSQWCVMGFIVHFWIIESRNLREGPDPVIDGLSVQGAVLSISIGAVFALASCLATALLSIPSSILTVFRMRSGDIGSLRSSTFRPLRFAQDNNTALFGSALWGAFYSSVMIWAIVASIPFAFFWETTRSIALSALAAFIGLLTTLIFRQLILLCLRRTLYGAFYRRRPLAANLLNLILECWNLGLTTGYILGRSVKLVMLAIVYMGRIDTPFLADGVGWLFGARQVPLDSYPIAFRKELVSHEAHRHPYMERWSTLYLLKLRHGPKFGNQAGAAWRILFVLALMPWMRKYRQYPDVETDEEKKGRRDSAGYKELVFRNQALELEVEALKGERRRVQLENDTLRKTLAQSQSSGRRRFGSSAMQLFTSRRSFRTSLQSLSQAQVSLSALPAAAIQRSLCAEQPQGLDCDAEAEKGESSNSE